MRILFVLLTTLATFAAAPSAEQLNLAAQNYLAKKPVSGFQPGFSLDDGYAAQSEFVKLISKKLGPIAGWKIGLITKPNQERLGATGPVRGALLRRMLLPNGSTVRSNYGLKPAVELDMGVYVKNDSINNAQSIHQIIAGLSDLVCFIELVDTIAATNQPMDAAVLVSLDVGARAGIIGQRRHLSLELASALPQMKMTLLDSTGKTLAEVPKLDLQPLENIPGLVASLKKEGKKLRAGDFISLGSPAAPQPVPHGQKVILRYENIPGGPLEATVKFPE
jgi:2-keto-4-pentenoate hydratase